eukprot:1110807-Pelagomonas_calceolata.AAC.2
MQQTASVTRSPGPIGAVLRGLSFLRLMRQMTCCLPCHGVANLAFSNNLLCMKLCVPRSLCLQAAVLCLC